jgi:hypothetical protein
MTPLSPVTLAALCRASAPALRSRAQGALAELLVARAAAQAADAGERACARAWLREAEERLAGAEEVRCCCALPSERLDRRGRRLCACLQWLTASGGCACHATQLD